MILREPKRFPLIRMIMSGHADASPCKPDRSPRGSLQGFPGSLDFAQVIPRGPSITCGASHDIRRAFTMFSPAFPRIPVHVLEGLSPTRPGWHEHGVPGQCMAPWCHTPSTLHMKPLSRLKWCH